MLSKLIKYDIKDISKVLIIFYSLSLIFALLTRIFLSIEASFIMNLIGSICSGTTISMIFNIIINNIMRLWARFRRHFYKDESYLTHTLPIKKETLYLSKILTTVITLFTSSLVIGLSLFIAYYSKENIQVLKSFILPIADAYDSTIINILVLFLFVFFIEILNAIQVGYTGIILGYKMNNNKIALSVLYGLISYGISQAICLLVLFSIGLFNKGIMNLFYTKDLIDIDVVKTIVLLGIIVYTIITIIIYFINVNMFKKGVNIE